MENETSEKQIGYLLRSVEENREDVRRLATKVDTLTRIVENKFNTAETLFKVLRFMGIALIAILTFKFGDIKEWWIYFFKS